jgi:serine/threonine protein kinase
MSDIYSFGFVLLEIMSGKCAHAKDLPQCEDKPEPLLINKHKLFQFMDSDLEGQYSPREAMEVASIAIHCLCTYPKNRPNIDEVVRSLEQL